ncbi:MAG TPA: hypothetical protein VKC51_00840 [Lacunisphaera sp.]|nr:hypothetical protein [Lacunisphaera sp.]
MSLFNDLLNAGASMMHCPNRARREPPRPKRAQRAAPIISQSGGPRRQMTTTRGPICAMPFPTVFREKPRLSDLTESHGPLIKRVAQPPAGLDHGRSTDRPEFFAQAANGRGNDIAHWLHLVIVNMRLKVRQ